VETEAVETEAVETEAVDIGTEAVESEDPGALGTDDEDQVQDSGDDESE
jgi:hypothetical protein